LASIAGKTVLITGAGSGIGAATAIEVVRRGGRVALVDANADARDEGFVAPFDDEVHRRGFAMRPRIRRPGFESLPARKSNSAFHHPLGGRMSHFWVLACAAVRRGGASEPFAGYATGWQSALIGDAPDRARFEAALEHRLLPELGARSLLEVAEFGRG
jgi:hypothetical protein